MPERTIALLAVLLLLMGCHSETAEDASTQQVLAAFSVLNGKGQLPGLKAGDHGDISAFRINEKSRRDSWFLKFRDLPTTCRNLFLVEVSIHNSRLSYFFCNDGETPSLVASFEMKGGEWIRISTKE
jgi:hypothetical protein